jgi:predicted ArsR family transcriptional regulator
MSIQHYRQRLQRVLFMVRHNQFQSALQASKILKCHPTTVKRLIVRLRVEGHHIKYEKSLKRYVLIDDVT